MFLAKCAPALLACGLGLATPALAQTDPGTPTQIADAIEACKAITTTEKTDYRRLESLGWPTAERRGGNRTRNKVIGTHQAEGNPVLVIVADEEKRSKTCVVRARLADSSAYATTLQGLSEIVGMPVRAEESSYFWTLDGHAMRVDPTGSRDEPVARFEISALTADQQETAQ